MKCNLKKINLLTSIENAIANNAFFIAVVVKINSCEKEEIIINRKENFIEKLKYYDSAYDDNLCLKNNQNIKIVDFTFGDTFEELEEDLKCWCFNEKQ